MPALHCVVESADAGVTFRWWHGQDPFPVYAFAAGSPNLRRLDKAADACRRVYEQEILPAVLAGGADGPGARAAYRLLAEAGAALRDRLFEPTGDAEPARRVARWLADLRAAVAADDPVEVEVVNEADRPVPWNLVYDEPPAADAFAAPNAASGADWEPFWAVRYNLFGGRRVDPRRRRPLAGPGLRVVVLADPAALDGLDDHRGWLDRFAAAGRAPLLTPPGGPPGPGPARVLTRADELPGALRDGRPDVLYCLCHTAESGLQLDDGPLDPDDLFDLLARAGGRDVPGGLVFLNACKSAVPRPGGASFWRNVFDLGMSGLVGTEHDVLNTVAAPLGARFLAEFCGGKPAGAVMRRLRADPDYLPFSLLYAANCPPDLRVAGGVTTPPDERGGQSGAKAPQVLGAHTGERVAAVPLPDQPYPRLGVYTRADRALFAGRDRDVERFAHILDQPGCQMLLLHGESGVGKSSFLAAGVVPYLEDECVGYRFVRDAPAAAAGSGRDEPILFVRATDDLASRLGEALTTFAAQPVALTADGHEHQFDVAGAVRPLVPGGDIPAALAADPTVCGRLLAAVGAVLPYRPVLVIDQAEEVFTLVRSPEQKPAQDRALAVLRSLAEAEGNFAVVVGLRTEYFGRLLDRLRTGVRQAAGVREYLLTDLDRAGVVDAITRPTRADRDPDGAVRPRGKWGFGYAPGVAEDLADRVEAYTTNRRDSVLPLAQIICGQLYDRVKDRAGDKTITTADLDHVDAGPRPGILGVVARRTDAVARWAVRMPRRVAGTIRVAGRYRTRVAVWLASPPGEGSHRGDRPAPARTPRAADRSGTVGHAMRRHVEGVVRTMFTSSGTQYAFRSLLADLYLSQPDGTLTTALVPVDLLKERWGAGFDELLAQGSRPEFRLLKVSDRRGSDGPVPLVSLGHDALAPVAAVWRAERQEQKKLRVYTGIAVAACVLAGMMAVLLARADEAERSAVWFRHKAEESASDERAARLEGAKALRTSLLNQARALRQSTAPDRRDRALKALKDAAAVPDLPLDEPTLLAARSEYIRALDLPGFRFVTALPPLSGSGEGERTFRGFVWLSPPGDRVIAFPEDAAPTEFDPATGRATRTFPKIGPTRNVAVSPDGRFVATDLSAGRGVGVYDLQTGDLLQTLPVENGELAAAAFSGGGQLATVTGTQLNNSLDKRFVVRIHEIRDFSLVAKPWEFVAQATLGLVFHPTGRTLAVNRLDSRKDKPNELNSYQSVQICSIIDGTLIADFNMSGSAARPFVANGQRSVVFSPDGELLAVGGFRGSVRVWHAATRKEVLSADAHEGVVGAVQFAPDGRWLATLGEDGRWNVWDVSAGGLVSGFRFGSRFEYGALNLQWARDAPLVLCGRPNKPELWEFSPPVSRALPDAGAGSQREPTVGALQFTPDGRWLGVGRHGRAVQLVDLSRPGESHPHLAGIGELTWGRLTFAPDGSTVVTDTIDGELVWRLPDPEPRRANYVWPPPPPLGFGPSGERLAAGSERTVETTVYDLKSGAVLWSRSDPGQVRGSYPGESPALMSFSPDGAALATFLMTPSGNGKVDLRDATTGNPRYERTGLAQGLFFRGGRPVAVTNRLTLSLRDLEHGRVANSAAEVDRRVPTLFLAADSGAACVERADDGSLRVWDLATARLGKSIHRDEPPWAEAVGSPALNSDGSRLAARDGFAVRVWDTRTDEELARVAGRQAHFAFVRAPSGPEELLLIGEDGVVRSWQAGQPVTARCTLRGDHGLGKSLRGYARISADGARAVICPDSVYSPTVTVWDLRTGERGPLLPLSPPEFLGAFDMDASLMLCADTGVGRLAVLRQLVRWRIQDLAGSTVFSTTSSQFGGVGQICQLSIDGRHAAWEERGRIRVVPLDRRGTGVECLIQRRPACFSVANGARYVAFGEGNEVMLADLVTELQDRLPGHEGAVSAAAFDPTAATLASAAADGTVRLWEVGSKKALAVFHPEQKGITALALSPEGRWLATGGADGRVRLWDVAVVRRYLAAAGLDWDAPTPTAPPQRQVLTQLDAGQRHLLFRRYAEALSEFDGVIAKEPGSVAAWYGRGVALSRQEKWIDAAAAFARAVALDPKNPWARGYLGDALGHLARWDAAAAEYSAAAGLGLKEWWVWAGQGRAHAESGRWEQADHAYARAAPLGPPGLGFCSEAARVWLHLGREDSYRQFVKTLLTPGVLARGEELQGAWVCALGELDDPAQALKLVDWFDRVPKMPEVERPGYIYLRTRGAALYRAGQYRTALATLETEAVRKANGGRGDAADRLFLAMTFHRLGRMEDSRRCLQEAQNIIESAANSTALPWGKRLDQQILLREARGLIDPKK